MKLELFEIVEAYQSFDAILKNNEIKFSLAWKLADVIEPLKKHVERFNEERNKIIKEFGTEQPDTGQFIVEKAKISAFETKLNEVGKTSVEIKNVAKIEKKELLESEIKINRAVNLKALKLFLI